MATALLAYSGIALKMLVDQRLGAVLHTMFMVEYRARRRRPAARPPARGDLLRSSTARSRRWPTASASRCGAGDVFWTGVGCIHAFWNRSDARVRWLETQSPQPPANHSYRFNRDWDYLAERLAD